MKSPDVRIALFGLPGAGKSALLGAFVQAAHTQEAMLGGKLVDADTRLQELSERVYSKKELPAEKDNQRHRVTWKTEAGTADVQLTDYNGKIAQEIVTGKIDAASVPAAFVEDILQADSIIYVADGSVPGTQLEKDFALFCNFIRSLEEHRGRNAEVAGLPVYLVLSKCDLKATPQVTNVQWMQGIEDWKRKIDKKVHDFLEKETPHKEMLFGTADVQLWATAVKRPALADRPAKTQEPFMVAELFRQVLRSARQFQDSREHVRHIFQGILFGFGGLIAMGGLVVLALFLNRPDAELAAYEAQIQTALGTEILREPLLERQEEIEKLTENPNFKRISPALRSQVKSANDEIAEYLAYQQAFLQNVPDLRGLKEESDLDRLEKSLTEFTLPKELEERWAETKLVQRRQQLLDDSKKLRDVIKEEEKWFKAQHKEGLNLVVEFGSLKTPEAKEKWRMDVGEYVGRAPRHKETDRVPGTGMLFKTVYRFDPVAKARTEWQKTKTALLNLSGE